MEEVKEQYEKVLQVRWPTLLCLKRATVWQLSTSVQTLWSCLLQESLEACQLLNERLGVLEKKKSELALYLCEDTNQLSLEELFGTIKTFRGLFIKALKVRGPLFKSHSCQRGNGSLQRLRMFFSGIWRIENFIATYWPGMPICTKMAYRGKVTWMRFLGIKTAEKYLFVYKALVVVISFGNGC